MARGGKLTGQSTEILNAVAEFPKKNLLIEGEDVLGWKFGIFGIWAVSPFTIHEFWSSTSV
jgi:hypothetical protein